MDQAYFTTFEDISKITDGVENHKEQNKTQTKTVVAHRSVIWSEKIMTIYF